jgi:hypothetical protein
MDTTTTKQAISWQVRFRQVRAAGDIDLRFCLPDLSFHETFGDTTGRRRAVDFVTFFVERSRDALHITRENPSRLPSSKTNSWTCQRQSSR